MRSSRRSAWRTRRLGSPATPTANGSRCTPARITRASPARRRRRSTTASHGAAARDGSRPCPQASPPPPGSKPISGRWVSMPPLDLDLPGDPAGHRVVVAMSGGVDSSVVAALLAEAGFAVVGVTLQLYDHGAAVGK